MVLRHLILKKKDVVNLFVGYASFFILMAIILDLNHYFNGIFKKIHYTRLFQNYKIYYIYCLSDWYKKKEYVSTLDLLKEFDIKIFWGNDLDYKNKMMHFICQLENI